MKLAWIFLSLSLMFSSPAWAQSNDEMFADARDAYKRRDEQMLVDIAQQLQAKDYILAPYVDYWLILLRLSQASDDSVRDFLNRYPDYPFTDRVRGEWLKALGKRQEWPTFFEELPHFRREDAAVKCYELDGRAQQGETEVLADGQALWLVSGEQPANCNLLFDRMAKGGTLTEEDIWKRFRLALQENKPSVAKTAVMRLPNFELGNLKLLDRTYENPQRTLEKALLSNKTRYGRELNLYALERMARSQPEFAQDSWKRVQFQYTPEERSYFSGRYALHAARRHDPTALEWFDRAQALAPDQSAQILDKEQLAWRARAAMRALNWPYLVDAIEAMPEAQREEGVWRYWKARALKEQKQIPAANALLVPLSRERTYYGLLAQEELGDAISEPPSYYRASDEEVQNVRNIAAIQRSIELQRQDLRWESRTEWAWATRDFDDRHMIAAAELAAEQEWYDLSILTADKTTVTHDFSLRYPTPYRNIMKASVREQGLDEAWVYGLIRQESRFIAYAKSGVGASGLMQVMPATAKWIAKRMGLNDYNHGKIGQLDTNIQLGTYYMRHVLDQLGGQPLLATAAYNAGPSRAKRWAAAQSLEGAIYAETIPFSETRNYVQKVMSNAYFYAHRLGIKIQPLKQRLGVVAGTGGVMVLEETE
ncbi:MAG TPA: transglycosylase SLT domain-containing protein [Methylophilaceae bacterium]|nr:transglycosylase SLT domain-containing protein [Methylophilaceae bacterium]